MSFHQQSAPAQAANPAQAAHRIRVVDLVKTYQRQSGGGVIVPVNHVSLDVSVDEMLVLLGPSGCGKTTLLRCVAGLEKPDSGEIYINDRLVFSAAKNVFLPPNRRPVSMVFQSYALWPHMSIFENVAYPLRSRGVTAGEIKNRVIESLRVVGLDALASQFPGQISGGQQQRVALARAVIAGTGVVLFDEPLSNVDAKVREQLRLEIRRLQRALGFSALYVTHDQSEAMAVADRIAVLGDGNLVQLGTPEDIYNLPNSSYVGNFVGGANIWSCTVTALDSAVIRVSTSAGEFLIDRTSPMVQGMAEPVVGAEMLLLARPEAMDLQVGQPASSVNSHKCIIDARVFLGPQTEYLLAVGEHRLRATLNSGGRLREGGEAWFAISPQSLRLLPRDAASGGR